MLDTFTVTLRGQRFTIYRDQIEFDAPNYFTALFLGDFQEAQSRSVSLSRNPDLFRIIIEYLSGYTVLPLSPSMIPSSMTKDTVLENLLRDGEFYQLHGLVRLLRPLSQPRSTHSKAHEAFGLAQQTAVEFSDLLAEKTPTGILFDDRGVGCLGADGWKPCIIVARGLLLLSRRNPWFSALFTEAQKNAISARCTTNVLPWGDVGPIEGRNYYVPTSRWGPQGRLVLDGIQIDRDDLTALCAAVKQGATNSTPFAEQSHALNTQYNALLRVNSAESGRLLVWCNTLFFTILSGDGGTALTVRMLRAECESRVRFVDDLFI